MSKQSSSEREPPAAPSAEALYARYENGWYYCWLIERRDRPQPEWWTDGPYCTWTTDAHNAMWYARRDQADAMASEMTDIDVFVCEHGFWLERAAEGGK